jgi:hypothetical protein
MTVGGDTFVSLSGGKSKVIIEEIGCSPVGLLNVLNGVEYVAVSGGRQCLARLQGKHVELILRRGKVDAVFRLTVDEYRYLVSSADEQRESAA